MSGFASIYGGGADDQLVGGAGSQFISGNGGDDFIEARGGADIVQGGDGNDVIDAGGGADFVLAQAGNDLAFGGNGDDVLLGGAGNDELLGGNGDDALGGDAGNDTLEGGAGDDAFVYTSGFGNDLIVDFSLGDDVLQIEANINNTKIQSAADVANLVSDDGFGNAVITLGSDTITLAGISPTDVQNNIGSIVNIV